MAETCLPGCVTDVEDKMEQGNDGAAGCNDGKGLTSREVKTNRKTAAGTEKKSAKKDESEDYPSLEVMAVTPDEKQPTTAVMTEADGVATYK